MSIATWRNREHLLRGYNPKRFSAGAVQSYEAPEGEPEITDAQLEEKLILPALLILVGQKEEHEQVA